MLGVDGCYVGLEVVEVLERWEGVGEFEALRVDLKV